MVKKPAMSSEPIFPLAQQYFKANYSIEGLDRKHRPGIPGCDASVYDTVRPEISADDELLASILYTERRDSLQNEQRVECGLAKRLDTQA